MMEHPNQRTIRFQLGVVVATYSEKKLLGIQACTRCNSKTQFNLICWRRLLQGVFFGHFGRTGGINLECPNLRSFHGAADVKTGYSSKAIGSERADEKTNVTLPVVYKL